MTLRPYASTGPAQPRQSTRSTLPAAVIVVALALGIAIVATSEDNAQTSSAGGGHLFLQTPGWTITRHDEAAESGATHFETRYQSGYRHLDLHQRPHGYNDEFMQTSSNFSVLGHDGVLFRGSVEYRAFWRDDDRDFELRGCCFEEAEFRRLLASLQLVDEATWDRALPESVVRPANRERVMAEVLTGVPLPLGHDAVTNGNSVMLKDRYQFAAGVIKSVLCGWMEQWSAARRAGDAVREKEALDALQSSSAWPVMIEMAANGGFPMVVRSSIGHLTDEASGDAAAQRFVQGFGCGQPPR